MTNPSGISPTEYKVLVKPKPVEAKIGSIIIPVSKQESDKYATVEGTVVAVSPLAFTYATEAEWAAAGAEKPKPGDAILYAKYAGVWVKGKDAQEYLLINDKDLVATIEE
jgi:co-chaperonin GroES (HSP10)